MQDSIKHTTPPLEIKMPDYGQWVTSDTHALIKEIREYAGILEKQSPKKLEKQKSAALYAEYEREKQMMPTVVVQESGPVDIVRDAKWVYENIGRLFYRDEYQLERLDEEVLESAPSNGAISMAHYCWNNRKEFFEKFVFTKTMTTDSKEKEQTEEQIAAELDPSFEGLERYLEDIDG